CQSAPPMREASPADPNIRSGTRFGWPPDSQVPELFLQLMTYSFASASSRRGPQLINERDRLRGFSSPLLIFSLRASLRGGRARQMERRADPCTLTRADHGRKRGGGFLGLGRLAGLGGGHLFGRRLRRLGRDSRCGALWFRLWDGV